MKKRIFLTLIMSVLMTSIAFAQFGGSPFIADSYIATQDVNLGTNSITCDSSTGCKFDSDNDGNTDITFPGTGGATIGGTNERITGSTNGEYIGFGTDDEILFQGVGGSDDTDIRMDLDGTAPRVYSNTDTTIMLDEIIDHNDKAIINVGDVALDSISGDSDAIQIGDGSNDVVTINPGKDPVAFTGNGGVGTLKLITYQDDTFEDDEYLMVGSPHVEIITNYGFEGTYESEGTGFLLAPNWNSNGLDEGVDTASKEAVIVHNGSASQHIVVDANGEGIKADLLNGLTQNGYFVLSGWVYIPSGGAGGTVRLYAAEEGGDYTVYTAAVTTATQDVWVNLQLSFQHDDTNPVYIVSSSSGGAAEWYIDNVTLTEVFPSSGFGTVSCGAERLDFNWATDGSVGGEGTTNTALTDSDTDLSIFDNGVTPIIRNRLGSSCEMRAVTWYN